MLLGELGLDGRVRGVRGILPATLAAAQHGLPPGIVPRTRPARLGSSTGSRCSGWARSGSCSLSSATSRCPMTTGRGGLFGDRLCPRRLRRSRPAGSPDAARPGRRGGSGRGEVGLEVAAAGRHHLMFYGPPGVGKTMLAERLPGLLPDLGVAEALEVSAIHSMAGVELDEGLIMRPPYAGSAPFRLDAGGDRRRPDGWPGRAQSPAPIAECCSWTRRRSSRAMCWRGCGSRWSPARCSCTAASSIPAIPRGSS